MLLSVYLASSSKLLSLNAFNHSEDMGNAVAGPSQTDSNKDAILPTEATNLK